MRVPTVVPRARAACCHEHVFAAAREHPSLRAPALLQTGRSRRPDPRARLTCAPVAPSPYLQLPEISCLRVRSHRHLSAYEQGAVGRMACERMWTRVCVASSYLARTGGNRCV